MRPPGLLRLARCETRCAVRRDPRFRLAECPALITVPSKTREQGASRAGLLREALFSYSPRTCTLPL
jgi:hypothetical protein